MTRISFCDTVDVCVFENDKKIYKKTYLKKDGTKYINEAFENLVLIVMQGNFELFEKLLSKETIFIIYKIQQLLTDLATRIKMKGMRNSLNVIILKEGGGKRKSLRICHDTCFKIDIMYKLIEKIIKNMKINSILCGLDI